MPRTTKPGTVQIRVIADQDQTEDFSRKLCGFLKSNGMEVIDCTPDYRDYEDEGRKKFFVTAIPKRRMNHSATGSAPVSRGGQ